MGPISGEVPRYKVYWRRGDSPHQPFAAFEGNLALSQACEFYEKLKADLGVTELAFIHLDRGVWEWQVPPLRRTATGEWQSA
jgi:hypothetical protein